MQQERRGKFDEARYNGQAVNPTANVAIALADGVGRSPVTGFRPMRIERLLQVGGKLTDDEQARVLLHQLGDVAEVTARMGRPESWVREACAWDLASKSA